jgi:hypothetical protein
VDARLESFGFEADCRTDGKKVSIEGRFGKFAAWVMAHSGSWLCLDTSLRESRCDDSKVCSQCISLDLKVC